MIQFASLPTEAAQFMDLFGVTLSQDAILYSAGFLAGSDPSGDLFGDAIVGNAAASLEFYGAQGELFAVADNFAQGDFGSDDSGSFLVRPIPELSTGALVAFGLLWLSLSRFPSRSRRRCS